MKTFWNLIRIISVGKYQFIQNWEELNESIVLSEEFKQLKINALDSNNYEKAALYRSKEKEYLEKIKELKNGNTFVDSYIYISNRNNS
jgi:hypothetical protein